MEAKNWKSPAERRGLSSEKGEPYQNEFYRLWFYEIKPSFKAEEDFLLRYPSRTQAGEAYAERIFIEHGCLEELFWKAREKGIGEFMRRLSALVSYKEDYFVQQVAAVLEKGMIENSVPKEDGSA